MSDKSNKNKKPNKGEKQPQKKDDAKGQKSQKKPDKNPKQQVKDVKPSNPYPKKEPNPLDNISEPATTENTRGKYSRRKIESNWTRLELPENIYDIAEEQSRQSNVEEIFKKPISLGGHFQFKHEKSWNFVAKVLEDNDLFTLNLKKITEHLLCVPFHERNDIDPALFHKRHVESMEQTANSSKLKYGIQDYDSDIFKNIISDDRLPDLTSINLKIDCETEDVEMHADDNTSDGRKSSDSDELDRILNLTDSTNSGLKISKPDIKPSIETTIDPNDNLEDWLDEFL